MQRYLLLFSINFYLKGRNCLRNLFLQIIDQKMPWFTELIFPDGFLKSSYFCKKISKRIRFCGINLCSCQIFVFSGLYFCGFGPNLRNKFFKQILSLTYIKFVDFLGFATFDSCCVMETIKEKVLNILQPNHTQTTSNISWR